MRIRLRQLIRIYHRYFIIGGLIFFGAVFFVSWGGYYPIAVVDGDWITARRFRINIIAAETYERRHTTSSVVSSILKNGDLTTAVLEGLIENKIIERGARKEFGDRFESLVSERSNNFLNQSKIIEEESLIYGLDPEKFKLEIIRPQATRDLLAGRLFLRSMRLEDWLKIEKEGVRVHIFSRFFYWDGHAVKIN